MVRSLPCRASGAPQLAQVSAETLASLGADSVARRLSTRCSSATTATRASPNVRARSGSAYSPDSEQVVQLVRTRPSPLTCKRRGTLHLWHTGNPGDALI